jgi:hypothetical protein
MREGVKSNAMVPLAQFDFKGEQYVGQRGASGAKYRRRPINRGSTGGEHYNLGITVTDYGDSALIEPRGRLLDGVSAGR